MIGYLETLKLVEENPNEVIIGLYNKASLDACWALGKDLYNKQIFILLKASRIDLLKSKIQESLDSLHLIIQTWEKNQQEIKK